MVGRLKRILAISAIALAGIHPAGAAPLAQVAQIPLGAVKGPVSDLAIDYANQRLFVLEPEAGALAVADMAAGKLSQTLSGLDQPRGMARAPTDNRLYVATASGRLAIFAGVPLRPEGEVALGADPGPMHYDAGSERIYVSFGGRKIGIIDSTHNKHWENIRLDGDLGSVVLEDQGSRIFIAARAEPRILLADRDSNKQTGSWSTAGKGPAAALALDEDAGRLLAAFRAPPALAWFDLADGTMKGSTSACAEPAELLSDSSRHRVYLTCGEGRIQIFARDAAGAYAEVGSIDTVEGAVAAVLVPTSGRLYLAVPAAAGHEAEVRIYAPAG
jgi:DNA-binding beta-propeller fold protein YncE